MIKNTVKHMSCTQFCSVTWCLPGHQAGFPPNMSLTLATNRISLLLFHVLPHASQAVSLYKQRLSAGPVSGQRWIVERVHGYRAGERAPGVFVVMGVSVILQVRARNRPHTEGSGFRGEGSSFLSQEHHVACLSFNVCIEIN